MNRLALGIVLLFTLRSGVCHVAAQVPVSWTNQSGDSRWETATNWTPPEVPNSTLHEVHFSIGLPCNLNSSVTVRTLGLDSEEAALNLVGGSALTLSTNQSVTNNGAILINSSNAQLNTKLVLSGNRTITGSGVIRLNGVNVAEASITMPTNVVPANSQLTHAAAHTIRGRGEINLPYGIFANQGTIIADAAGPLRITLSTKPENTSRGRIEAVNGGHLMLATGFVDASGGASIKASGSGSRVQVGNSFDGFTVRGGVFETADGGLITPLFYGRWTDCTNLGRLALDGIDGKTGVLYIDGQQLLNDGIIDISDAPGRTGGHLSFGGTTPVGIALEGKGEIRLDGADYRKAMIQAGGRLRQGPAHRIRGRGYISSNWIDNKGLISADVPGGTLRVEAYLTNAGTVEATNGGYLSFETSMEGTAGSVITSRGAQSLVTLGMTNPSYVKGERFVAADGGRITVLYPQLDSCKIEGDFEVLDRGSVYVLGSGLENNGRLLFGPNSSLGVRAGNLSGTGTIQLRGNMTFGSDAYAMTIGVGQTITGTGQIEVQSNVKVAQEGRIAPRVPGGIVLRAPYGSFNLGATSELSFSLRGTMANVDYGVLAKHQFDDTRLTLNGTLAVTLDDAFTPGTADVFTVVTTRTSLAGSFSNVASGGRLETADSKGSFRVDYNGNNVVLSEFQPAPQPPTATPTPNPQPSATPPSQPLNVSTRLRVQTGENVMIGGFIVTGTEAKKVIIRGIGPSLAQDGLHGGLADPVLELYGVAGLITTNDDWREDSTQAALIQASGVPPRSDLESAVVVTLPPDSYTAVVHGKNGTSGIGLVEVYDLNQTADSLLANISTRGFVDSGENAMIGGFILGGSSASSRVIIRAIGPSLRQSGLDNALSDPTLELFDGNGERISLNDDWKVNEQTGQSQEAEVRATTIEPTDDLEAAIVASLPAGSYTAIVRGKNGGTGVGLVEVYNLR